MIHSLKISPDYFLPILQGKKCFEVRKNDRHYQVGDFVILNEYFKAEQVYSGNKVCVEIKYITDFKQRPGYIVFGFDLRNESSMKKNLF